MAFAGLCLLLLVVSTFVVEADRTHEKIYVNVGNYSACFRRMNGTHQVGCSSSQGGDVGVVHYIDSDDSLDWLLKSGPHKPYIPLMTPYMFIAENIELLADSGKINGIMVIHSNETESPPNFSPDKKCPGDRYNMYDDTSSTESGEENEYSHCRKGAWNDKGSSLFFKDMDFPIMALTNYTEVQSLITDCYEKFNKPVNDTARSYPLCSAHVKDAMAGAKDSETCIRRSNMGTNLSPQKYCDPMGDKNIHALVHAINSTDTLLNESIIIAAARRDTFSLFDQLYPGADTVVTGLVTLLAAAEALGRVKADLEDTKPIMFALFSGESFDYIGSGRMVYEMAKSHFPTKLEPGQLGPHPIGLQHISGIIEVNQLGVLNNEDDPLWIHTDPISMGVATVKDKIQELTTSMQDAAQSYGLRIDEAEVSQTLPPASLQSFLKKKLIPGIVISDHKGNFSNTYYNSRFDLRQTIRVHYPDDLNETEWYDHVTPGAAHLQKVSTALARGLYHLSTGSPTHDLEADNTTVANLLYCFLVSAKCELFKTVVQDKKTEDKLTKDPYPFYAGVRISSSRIEWPSFLARNLFAYYLGDEVVNNTKCEDLGKDDPVNIYTWMQGAMEESSSERLGKCIKNAANKTSAVSPVFDSHEYSTKNYNWKSTEFSTWTESRWDNDAMTVRFFLVPDHNQEIAMLSSGIAILVLSLVSVYVINKRADLLFST